MPLPTIEFDADGLKTPALRVTGISEKEFFQSETTPTEIRKPRTPFLSKVVAQSGSLRQLLQSDRHLDTLGD